MPLRRRRPGPSRGLAGKKFGGIASRLQEVGNRIRGFGGLGYGWVAVTSVDPYPPSFTARQHTPAGPIPPHLTVGRYVTHSRYDTSQPCSPVLSRPCLPSLLPASRAGLLPPARTCFPHARREPLCERAARFLVFSTAGRGAGEGRARRGWVTARALQGRSLAEERREGGPERAARGGGMEGVPNKA